MERSKKNIDCKGNWIWKLKDHQKSWREFQFIIEVRNQERSKREKKEVEAMKTVLFFFFLNEFGCEKEEIQNDTLQEWQGQVKVFFFFLNGKHAAGLQAIGKELADERLKIRDKMHKQNQCGQYQK